MTDATSTSSLDASNSQLRRTWRLRPSVRRQERLDLDVPGCSSNLENSTSPSRDHGLRTPPGPPLTSSNNPPIQQRTRPTTLSDDMLSSSPNYLDPNSSQRYATHVMASDMSGLLAPPSRSGALARAHTDPTSNYSEVIQPQQTPNSPPPTYEEVMKQVLLLDKGLNRRAEDSSGSQCCSWSSTMMNKQASNLCTTWHL